MSSLARCATSGGPPACHERGERLAHRGIARAARRRRTWRASPCASATARNGLGDRRAVPHAARARTPRRSSATACRTLTTAAAIARHATSTSSDSAGDGSAADLSPTASSSRGSSVRNASWSKSTRTSLAVPRALAEIAGADVERRRRGRRSDICRLRNTRSRASPRFWRCFGWQLVEVLEDPLEVAVGGRPAWPPSSHPIRARPGGCRSGRRGARRTPGTARR